MSWVIREALEAIAHGQECVLQVGIYWTSSRLGEQARSSIQMLEYTKFYLFLFFGGGGYKPKISSKILFKLDFFFVVPFMIVLDT